MPNHVIFGRIAVLAALFSIPSTAFANNEGCEALQVPNPYLNAQFCSRLKALQDNRVVPPTRGLNQLDDKTRAAVENIPLIQDAFEADPAKALELIKRIREAGGLTN